MYQIWCIACFCMAILLRIVFIFLKGEGREEEGERGQGGAGEGIEEKKEGGEKVTEYITCHPTMWIL